MNLVNILTNIDKYIVPHVLIIDTLMMTSPSSVGPTVELTTVVSVYPALVSKFPMSLSSVKGEMCGENP